MQEELTCTSSNGFISSSITNSTIGRWPPSAARWIAVAFNCSDKRKFKEKERKETHIFLDQRVRSSIQQQSHDSQVAKLTSIMHCCSISLKYEGITFDKERKAKTRSSPFTSTPSSSKATTLCSSPAFTASIKSSTELPASYKPQRPSTIPPTTPSNSP